MVVAVNVKLRTCLVVIRVVLKPIRTILSICPIV